MEKDYSISAVRFFATCFIILCHILQFLGNELAFWFNVGVQMFLCISGWLYAKKRISNGFVFFLKNFLKLYVGYLLVTFLFGIVGFIKGYVSLREIIHGFLAWSTFNGGSHLWFIPTILLCYFITPFLQEFFDFVKVKSSKAWRIFWIVVFFLGLHLTVKGFLRFFTPAWIVCYILGYLLGRESNKILEIILCVIALIFNICKIILVYGIKVQVEGQYAEYYNVYLQYTHVLLGVLLVLCIAKLCNLLDIKQKRTLCKILDISDAYSYPIYLVHQFFILGSLSLMTLTDSIVLNVGCIFVFIVALAIPIKWISNKTNDWIRKIFR